VVYEFLTQWQRQISQILHLKLKASKDRARKDIPTLGQKKKKVTNCTHKASVSVLFTDETSSVIYIMRLNIKKLQYFWWGLWSPLPWDAEVMNPALNTVVISTKEDNYHTTLRGQNCQSLYSSYSNQIWHQIQTHDPVYPEESYHRHNVGKTPAKSFIFT
jgi:hypothetical protein